MTFSNGTRPTVKHGKWNRLVSDVTNISLHCCILCNGALPTATNEKTGLSLFFYCISHLPRRLVAVEFDFQKVKLPTCSDVNVLFE